MSSAAKTLHQRIRAWLLARAGASAPGALMPTEVAVAKRFAASRATTHKVLAELQRDGVVRRVKGRGTFVEPRADLLHEAPASIGGELRAPNGRVIIAYPHWFSYDLWATVDRGALVARELRLEPIEHHLDPGGGYGGLGRLVAGLGRVRGVILVPPGAVVDRAALHALDAFGVPVVVLVPLDAAASAARVVSLSKDCFQAGQLLVAALARRGHRRIAYVANEPWSASSELTYAGIKAGLYAAGLRLRDLERGGRRVRPWESSLVAGRELTTSLLCRDPSVTGLIFDSVPGVIGGLAAARELGFRVPEDLSLVVNDSFAGFEEHLWPAITATVVDRAALVRRAMELITGPMPARGPRALVEPVRLIERASIARPSRRPPRRATTAGR